MRPRVVGAALLVVAVGVAVQWGLLGRGRDASVATPDVAATDGGADELAAAGRPRVLGEGSPPAAASFAGRIVGVVLDADERPVAGISVTARRRPQDDTDATVGRPDAAVREQMRRTFEALDAATATAAEPPGATATTGPDGRFALAVDRAGGWLVEAVVAPPRLGTHREVDVPRDAREVAVVLRLAAGHALRGRVLDAAGHALAAFVTVALDDDRGAVRTVPVATEPATGAFVVPAAPDGAAWAWVRVPGRVEARFFVRTPRADEVVLRLPGGVVRGRVTDGHGAPVADVDLAVAVEDGEDAGTRATARGRTLADGTYRVDGLPAGRIDRIEVVAAGAVPRTEQPPSARWSGTRVAPDAEAVVDLVLARGSTIEGRVLDRRSGAPVAGADVRLLPAWGAAGAPATSAVVDAEGGYRLEGVLPGRYALLPRAPTHVFLPACTTTNPVDGNPQIPIVVIPGDGETARRVLLMDAGLEVRGRVVGPEGRAIGGAEVRATEETRPDRGLWSWGVNAYDPAAGVLTTASADGTFRVRNLPPTDALRLVATHAAFAGEPSAPLRVASGAPVPEVVLTMTVGAALVGRVVDAAGGTVPGASVVARGAAGGPAPVTLERSAVTDADGRYRLDGLPSIVAAVSVWAGERGGAGGTTTTALAAGETRTLDDLVLVWGERARIRGVVVDAEGRPCRRSVVAEGMTNASTESDPDGQFELRVPRGPYRVGSPRHGTSDLAGAGVDVEAPAEGVRVVAGAAAGAPTGLRVRVVGPDDAAIPSCLLTIEPVAPGTASGSGEALGGEARLDVEGTAPFLVRARLPRDRDGAPMNLRAGSVRVDAIPAAEVTIRLDGGQVLVGRVVDPAGEGVGGVAVYVGNTSALTDGAGAFRVPGLDAEEVLVRADPNPPYAAPAATSARPGGEPVVLRLAVSAEIAGRVESDAPLGGLLVRVRAGGQSATVGPDGRFRLEGFAADDEVDVRVSARVAGHHPGRSPTFAPLVVPRVRAGTRDLVLRLERGATVRGQVVGADDRPVESCWLRAVMGDRANDCSVDATGRFEISGLPAGRWLVSVSAGPSGGTWLAGVPVDAPADDLRLKLPPLGRVSGRVVGLDGAHGSLVLRRPGMATDESVAWAELEGEGRFDVAVPGDGPFVACAQVDGRFGRAVGVRPGATIELTLEPGATIDGVLEGPDGRPLPSRWISARSDAWSAGASGDAHGAFRIVGLPPGRYDLRVYLPLQSTPVTLGSAEAGATGVRLRAPSK